MANASAERRVPTDSVVTNVPKKPQITSEMLDTIVVIRVGSEEREFRIHKGLLCSASPFFRAALEAGFKEASEQAIRMPGICADTFDQVQLWIYTGNVHNPVASHTRNRRSWHSLLNLYVFAESHMMPALQNDALDAIWSFFKTARAYPSCIVKEVYDKTSDNDLLRRLLVDLFIRGRLSKERWFRTSDKNCYSKEFLFDILLAQNDLLKAELKLPRTNIADYYVRINPEEQKD